MLRISFPKLFAAFSFIFAQRNAVLALTLTQASAQGGQTLGRLVFLLLSL
jgi:hypothetical protein